MQLKDREKLRTQYQNREKLHEKTIIMERIEFMKENITDKVEQKNH